MSSKYNQSRRRKPPGICRKPPAIPLAPLPPADHMPSGPPVELRGDLNSPPTILKVTYTIDLPGPIPPAATATATIDTEKKQPLENLWIHVPPAGAPFPAATINVRRHETPDTWSIDLTGTPSSGLFLYSHTDSPIPRKWPKTVNELILTGTPPGSTCTIHSIVARTTD